MSALVASREESAVQDGDRRILGRVESAGGGSPSIGIRGAGVAGLSLAKAILDRTPGASITLFDDRPTLPYPERSFCFFEDHSAICPVPVSHRWGRIGFSGPGFHRGLDCADRPYALIQGAEFFPAMIGDLERRGAKFHWQAEVAVADERTLATRNGVWRFDLVFDGAFRASGVTAKLWQSFAGMMVETPEPRFDPGEAMLMELGESDELSAVSFYYILPFSRRQALIEHTTFSLHPLPASQHWSACRRWLEARRIAGYTIGRTERGTIPLGLPVAARVASLPMRIGSAAGAVRAATGYAFQTIQRQCRELAAQVHDFASGRRAAIQPCAPYKGWTMLSDRLFLEALAKRPRDGALIFRSLLRDSPASPLIDFLSNNATLVDALQVMWRVPKRRMLETLCLG
jgi:lycopene beta-cyclase